MSDFPSPLTPPECDLRDFAYMPLDVLRLRDSDLASEQTPEENWAAVLLWAAAWHQVPAGSIPDSENWIAKAAGYMMRGRIDNRWKEVKAGAMRGFVLCSDGRWYHQVVCEKANESWISKLRQRHRTEVARIKKHNERHEVKLPVPEFEEWLSSVCRSGQPTNVAGDKSPLSLRQTPDVGSETASKGEGSKGIGKVKGIDNPLLVPTASDGGEQADLLPTEAPTSAPTPAPTPAPTDAPPPALPAKPKKHGTPEDVDCAAWIFAKVRIVAPSAKPPANWDDWANEIRLMRERDGRTHREICELFQWANRDSFWATNILSPHKLREKWTTLSAKAGQQLARPAAPNLSTEEGRAAQNKIEAEKAARILGFAPTGGDVIDMEAGNAR
jgi:hypothetical protein